MQSLTNSNIRSLSTLNSEEINSIIDHGSLNVEGKLYNVSWSRDDQEVKVFAQTNISSQGPSNKIINFFCSVIEYIRSQRSSWDIACTLTDAVNRLPTMYVTYGFSDQRQIFLDRQQKPDNSHYQTIDNFNKFIGLDKIIHSVPEYPDLNYFGVLNKIKTNNIYDEETYQVSLEESASKKLNQPEKILSSDPTRGELKKWCRFLNKNADKLDVFAKHINNKSLGEIKAFVTKNFINEDGKPPSDAIVTLYATAFMGLSKKENVQNGITHQMVREVNKVIKSESNEPNSRCNIETRIIYHILNTAFFRQTSKLGLDFFAEQLKTEINFVWVKYDGNSLTEEDINEKSWKGINQQPTHYEPITYSEARHVTQKRREFFKAIVSLVTPEVVLSQRQMSTSKNLSV